MKEYGMFTEQGEAIYKMKAQNIMEAITYFSTIKQMNIDLLLSLFDVKEIKR